MSAAAGLHRLDIVTSAAAMVNAAATQQQQPVRFASSKVYEYAKLPKLPVQSFDGTIAKLTRVLAPLLSENEQWMYDKVALFYCALI